MKMALGEETAIHPIAAGATLPFNREFAVTLHHVLQYLAC